MKLSIITINYNNLAGLEKTTQSIFSQSYNDYEWIVIDGGSDDGSRDFLTKHNAKITYWCSEKDNGIYNAMNKGILKAQGDYVLFLNSGDSLYENDTLEQVFKADYNADILYGDALFLYPDKPKVLHYDEQLTLKRMYEYSINHQSTFIKASLLKERGYDENYKIVADWKRFVEWLVEGRVFLHLPIIVSRYDTCGISSNVKSAHQERNQFFLELFGEDILDALKDWLTFQNKPCLQTRDYCNENKFFRRIIRSTLHFITWIRKIYK